MMYEALNLMGNNFDYGGVASLPASPAVQHGLQGLCVQQ